MTSGRQRDALIALRPADTADFPLLFRLTLQGLGAGNLAEQVGSSDGHPFHAFTMQHGDLLVAELDGQIAGYASSVPQGEARILSQLFVRDDIQSRGVGKRLFEEVEARGTCQRLLQASDDPRAIGLYARYGYVPAWPVYSLLVPAEAIERLPLSHLEAIDVVPGSELNDLDLRITRRSRPEVFAFWLESAGGTAYLLNDGNRIVGYGWIHDPLNGALARWYGADAPLAVGPVGSVSDADSWDCLRALLAVIQGEYPGRGAMIEIPGPHPALKHLLSAGARIDEAETAMATDHAFLGDPERYIPSGGILC